MRDFVIMLVKGVMDALEEFFDSLTAPSTKFTLQAFIYSLIFLVVSVVFEFCEIPCFVQWQECLTCSILMFIIVLIDGSVRSDIKSGMGKIKSMASVLSYSGNGVEDGSEEQESLPYNEEYMEVDENGTGE